MFMDELTTFLVTQCAFKNDEFRKNLPINFITHEVVALTSTKPVGKAWKKNTKYKYDHFNGSLIISNKMLNCDNIYSVLKKVSNYDNFTKENDPYKEKRFGDITLNNLSFNGQTESESLIFWKIEFWDDNSLRHQTEDYLKSKSYRTLTIYHVDEA